MSEAQIEQDATATIDASVTAAEKVAGFLGLTDLTAALETVKNSMTDTLASAHDTIAKAEATLGALKALAEASKAHFEAMSPGAELAAAKAKAESIVAEVEAMFHPAAQTTSTIPAP